MSIQLRIPIPPASLELPPARARAAEDEGLASWQAPRNREGRPNWLGAGVTLGLHLALATALLIGNGRLSVPLSGEPMTVIPIAEETVETKPEPLPPPPMKTPRLDLPTVDLPQATEPSPNAITLPANPPAPRAQPSRKAIETYQSRLMRHLNRVKRYPPEAQRRRVEGVALLSFTIDPAGRVLAFRLERSSGNPLLDDETLAMIQRASPLPALPPEMARARLELVVPVEFTLR